MTPCASPVPTTMATPLLLVAVVHRAKSAREADREVDLKLARAVAVPVVARVAARAAVEVVVAVDAAEVAAHRETDRAEDAAAVDLALLLARNRYVYLYALYMMYTLAIDGENIFQSLLELN